MEQKKFPVPQLMDRVPTSKFIVPNHLSLVRLIIRVTFKLAAASRSDRALPVNYKFRLLTWFQDAWPFEVMQLVSSCDMTPPKLNHLRRRPSAVSLEETISGL